MEPTRSLFLVTEDYGEWTPVAVYESLEDAKALAPESDDWREDRGVFRNHGPGRDLFIMPIPHFAASASPPPPSAISPPIREEAKESTRHLLERAVRLLRDGYPDAGRYHEATETARDLGAWASSLRLDASEAKS